ncbi:hypothetical protein HRR83_006884 [Exophiala dermatitidis]|uniref:AB hydrolase-1 domain-containing protein n=3 Tax=Exophiala dermatitidis TaxID=5970 RepID=H6BKI9_EXODN|nr:uncharacterized protein HMPREF1120_00833 [Exophiala dermatitidis NIH/UT8656]XP_009153084.1 hypothetical protein, variant [Exophiala dermatitidis NIH/UT8656]KAJ4509791.1 hypothetical protein HRR75_005917 [Exophiala dermatitidis]EHY52622.1 hypothetical protein, variant [Exophiala dermatitidis NIH/UT8656]EHY52623.1 hypothetical protein HMPREF1120_00833 [Exophiala dermatitidis NIH/UT8656]KAJ4512369.1 hypothetical protein HRR73_005924 [Exophiala dermatitidis]KAJ4512756.1 hypothetical protein HR
MRKTLLLVFIHGFKGGDDTFGSFPEHLRTLLSHALPDVDVVSVTYPKFETRGDLKDCVARFREWLQNKVIDLEVARSTPSPTVDPSVHVMLLGHSMGGIVAAETYLVLANEQPLPNVDQRQNATNSTSHPTKSQHRDFLPTHSFMFPHIQGVLAFDTPFLGLAPGMVAHGLEGGHKFVSNAFSTYNEVASMFGWGSKSEPNIATSRASSSRALPAPSSATVDAAAAPRWQSWGKYAMFAGAAGAVVAGGAAALYSHREKLSAGWQWASDHLLFVGELFKPEFLRKRVENLEQGFKERGGGCANLYTNLGKGAREGYGITASVAGKERTFCNLPVYIGKDGKQMTRNDKTDGERRPGMEWVKAVNEKAGDETVAHVSMFSPRDNPGYYALGERAKEFLAGWVDQGWYRASSGPTALGKDHGINYGEVGDGWEKPDYDAEDVRAKERERDRQDDRPTTEADMDVTLTREWDSVEMRRRSLDDPDDDDEVTMRDDDHEDEDLEASVIVEKAANGDVALPTPKGATGL